jgi:hypothetical protein
MDASDIVAVINSSTTIAAGQTFGLGRLFFDVSPSALNNEVLTLAFNPSNSSLSDANGSPITIDTFQSGTITIVTSVTSVPEPGTGITVISLLIVFAICRMAKRRRTAA